MHPQQRQRRTLLGATNITHSLSGGGTASCHFDPTNKLNMTVANTFKRIACSGHLASTPLFLTRSHSTAPPPTSVFFAHAEGILHGFVM